MLIASAKFRSARGASQQPAFMSRCLTFTCICPVYLVEEHWRCWEGGEPKRWESSELGRREKGWRVGSELVRWESWEDSEVARSERWKGSEVAIWGRWRVARWERWESSEVRKVEE